MNEYVVINHSDLQKLQDTMNGFARKGYWLQSAWSIPDHRGATHMAVMVRTVAQPEAAK